MTARYIDWKYLDYELTYMTQLINFDASYVKHLHVDK